MRRVLSTNYDTGLDILIISGIHGDEYTPIMTTSMLLEESNIDKLSNIMSSNKDIKSITIVSGANMNAIESCTRFTNPTSTNDLNRKFDYNSNIYSEKDLKNDIDKANVIIDIHSSPKCTDFLLLNIDENLNSYIDFCKKINIPYLNRYSDANTIKKYGLDSDKISFTLELNSLNYIDMKSANNGLDIIYKIISNISMFKKIKEAPIYSEYEEIKTYHKGLFIPSVDVGTILEKGALIGKILDIESNEMIDVFYEKEYLSTLICFGGNSFVSPSNSICYIQKYYE